MENHGKLFSRQPTVGTSPPPSPEYHQSSARLLGRGRELPDYGPAVATCKPKPTLQPEPCLLYMQAVLGNDKGYVHLNAKEKDALLRAWKSFDNDTKAGEGVFLAFLEDDPDKETIMSFISNATSIPEEQLVSKGIIELIGKQTLGPYRQLMGALDDDEQLSKISHELRDLYIKDGSRPDDLDRKNMVVINVMKNRLGSQLNPEVEENLSKLFQTVRNRIFLEDE